MNDRITIERDIQPNPQSYEINEQLKKRERAVISLTDTTLYILVTPIHLIALGFISQKIQLPLEWGTRLATIFCCGLANLGLGYSVGKLFQLEILHRSKNPQIQKLLENTII